MGDQDKDKGPVWTRVCRAQGPHLLPDLQGALAQGLRLPVPPTLPVEDRQVVEGGSHLWVRGQQGLEVGRSGPPCSHNPTYRRMLRAQGLFPDLQGIVEEVSGFLILVLVPAGQGWRGWAILGSQAKLGSLRCPV